MLGTPKDEEEKVLERRRIQRHVEELLSLPLPSCLQLSKEYCAHAGRRGRGAVYNGSSATSSSPRRRVTSPSPTVRERPIYDVLLEAGRLRQERLERLQEEAIAKELSELRPAPSLAASSSLATPRRLPAPGQRIEDKLLRRAKEREEQRMLESKLRAARAEEDLARIATFRPLISEYAERVKSRYQNPPTDREEWCAKRREELAQTRQSAEGLDLQEMQSGPIINANSERLAAKKKVREGLMDVSVADASTLRDRQTRTSRNHSMERESDTTPIGAPQITPYAASLRRGGPVGDRLHAASYEAAVRRIQHEAHAREQYTPFTPRVTALGAVTAARYNKPPEKGDEGPLSARETTQLRHSKVSGGGVAVQFRPTINPLSSAIADQLPETPMERLCRVTAPRSLSTYADPHNLRSSRTSSNICTPHRRGDANKDEGCNTPQPPPALPVSVVAALDAYEKRRRARLNILTIEQEQRHREECTFHPSVNSPRTPHSSDDYGASAVALRSEQWASRRDQRVAELRRLHQTKEEEQYAAISSAPRSTQHPTSPNLSRSHGLPSNTVYGGDGIPWGVAEYVQRQQQARARHRERQEKEEHWSYKSDPTSALSDASFLTTPRFSAVPRGGECGDLRSLQPPLPVTQRPAVLQPSTRSSVAY